VEVGQAVGAGGTDGEAEGAADNGGCLEAGERGRCLGGAQEGAQKEGVMAVSYQAPWGSSYRLVAAEKWKAKSALMGSAVTHAFVEFSRPVVGMRVLDLASGTGEPGISLAESRTAGNCGGACASEKTVELCHAAR
jgi:hypothetical protein